MCVMYLDESGDHSLDKIDPQFPVFALAGCVFDKEVHDGTVEFLVRQYKLRLFGRHDIVLHTADIARNQRIVEAKFRRRAGDYRGAGLVVIPK